MRLSIILFFWLILASVSAQDSSYCKSFDELIAAESAAAEKKIAFRSNPLTDNYDVVYHRLEWSINPNRFFIQGTVTTYFITTQPEVGQIHFDMSENLNVTEIRYRGQNRPVVQPQGKDLAILLPAPLPQGTLDSITIRYQGAPTVAGFGSFVRTNQPDGTPNIWTLSEPYGAREWWPCKQSLQDKIDSIDVFITTPQLYQAASNGLLVSQEQKGPDRVYHWKHRYPIATYLIAVSVTRYETFGSFIPVEGREEPILFLNYVYPSSLESAKNQTRQTEAILPFFVERFGMYPFADEKYGHAEFGFGGGMEHQTMSFMGGFSHSLQAHELAHQWFGDKITCGSWQDIWLNEGFATYLDGMTYEVGLGFTDWTSWLKGKIASVTSQPGGSVYVRDTSSISRIFSSRLSYNKGAMVLHMLRWVLGDEDFFSGVRQYLNDPELAYRFARTPDLQRHLETVSGKNLDGFFQDWVYNEGYPNYQVQWAAHDDGYQIILNQTTSHSSVPFFEMPVPIVFRAFDGQMQRVVLEHTENGQAFTGALPFVPFTMEFDPESWLVKGTVSIDQVSSTTSPRHRAVKLYPNPAGQQLWVETPNGLHWKGNLQIVDMQGHIIRQIPTDFPLYVGDLAEGMYLLRGTTNEGQFIRKFQR